MTVMTSLLPPTRATRPKMFWASGTRHHASSSSSSYSIYRTDVGHRAAKCSTSSPCPCLCRHPYAAAVAFRPVSRKVVASASQARPKRKTIQPPFALFFAFAEIVRTLIATLWTRSRKVAATTRPTRPFAASHRLDVHVLVIALHLSDVHGPRRRVVALKTSSMTLIFAFSVSYSNLLESCCAKPSTASKRRASSAASTP